MIFQRTENERHERYFNNLARVYDMSILFLLTGKYIYIYVSYFNLLKENGIPRLVAAKGKWSEWFSKIRLLWPT